MSQAHMPTLAMASSRAFSLSLAALGIAAAFLASRQSLVTNLERACTVGDTPYLDLCPPAQTPRQSATELKSEIAANPGDSRAYLRLAFAGGSATNAALLSAAARLAPSHPNVIAMQAAQALEAQDLPTAVGPLVSLVEHGYNDRAALVLARLIVSGRWQLLAEHLRPGTHWFKQVLAQMPNAQGSFAAALPLVVLGLDRGVFAPPELMPYVRQLKTSGAWGDAYSLWVALHKGASPILFNASFNHPFEEDGFDWELPSQQPIGRAGAIVARAADESRGSVLDIRFTGRPFAEPLIRQHLFLGPGRYRLQGDYKTAQLRIEQGLAWSLRCTASAVQAGKSAGLGDTANVWRPFEFVFSVPQDCGWVATLQLEAFAPLDATLGSRGRASFSALALQKLEH
jgi:hypothetical protein